MATSPTAPTPKTAETTPRAIQEFAAQRGVKKLFHFTRLENVDSILLHGLMTRSQCTAKACGAIFNDALRIDGTDAVCASISFPNYKLFWPFRQNPPDAEWVVLALHPSVMWETRAAFCKSNAASLEVTGIPIEQRMELAAFREMFEDFNLKKRIDLNILDHYPTNPQAEVLLLDGVLPKYIGGIIVPTQSIKTRLEAKYPKIRPTLNGGFFSWRRDFEHWK